MPATLELVVSVADSVWLVVEPEPDKLEEEDAEDVATGMGTTVTPDEPVDVLRV